MFFYTVTIRGETNNTTNNDLIYTTDSYERNEANAVPEASNERFPEQERRKLVEWAVSGGQCWRGSNEWAYCQPTLLGEYVGCRVSGFDTISLYLSSIYGDVSAV